MVRDSRSNYCLHSVVGLILMLKKIRLDMEKSPDLNQ